LRRESTRRGIAPGPADSLRRRPPRHAAQQEPDVGGFEVAVDDALLVRVLHGAGEIEEELGRPARLHRRALELARLAAAA